MNHQAYVINFIVRRLPTGDEFLMAKRSEGKYMGGTWQLISGSIEENEIAWKAALREMMEEVQLQAIELYRLCTTNTFYRVDTNSLCTAIPFLAIVAPDAEVKLNRENTAFQWIKRSEMPANLIWPDDLLSFNDASTQILDNGPAKQHLAIDVSSYYRMVTPAAQ